MLSGPVRAGGTSGAFDDRLRGLLQGLRRCGERCSAGARAAVKRPLRAEQPPRGARRLGLYFAGDSTVAGTPVVASGVRYAIARRRRRARNAEAARPASTSVEGSGTGSVVPIQYSTKVEGNATDAPPLCSMSIMMFRSRIDD